MSTHKHNYIWLAIIIASLAGTFFIIKLAYANPLDLPDYAFSKGVTKEGYEFAKLSPEKLDGLRCNCGCMEDAGAHGGRLHSRGLLDCFVEGDLDNGGKWERHASECGLCVEDAVAAKRLYEQGKSKEEVKAYLEDKYSNQTISSDTVY